MIVDAHQHFCGPCVRRVSVSERRGGVVAPTAVRPRGSRAATARERRHRHGVGAGAELSRRDANTSRHRGYGALRARRRRLGRPDRRGHGRVLAGLGGKLVGVRHQVHDEPDPAWLLRPDVRRGLAAVGASGLAYDLLVRTRGCRRRSRPRDGIRTSASCSTTSPSRRCAQATSRRGRTESLRWPTRQRDVQAVRPVHRG